ncbi:MAG TPA: FecR family protein, partial [Verrucomicrobiae bacterium]|nr:FecR family protein [Verrucomicrobiae bacterium]
MDRQRLELLLHRYFDQLLEPAERTELESLLLNHAEARQEFWAMARCHALIRFWGEMESGYREAENFQPQPLCVPEVHRESILDRLRRLRQRWIPISAVAFGALLLLAAARVEWLRSSVVARVTRLSEAQWAAGPLRPGQALHRGWLRLDSGTAEIEFSRGARVVLQGPTELRLLSPNQAFLLQGKLNAVVPPPAHGFKVRTPEFSVVDLGTRFGCIVASNTPGEVHVFQGRVAWQSSADAASRRTLTADEALKISGPDVQSIAANPSLFVFEDELSREDWLRENRWLRTNDTGLVYLNFENMAAGAETVS